MSQQDHSSGSRSPRSIFGIVKRLSSRSKGRDPSPETNSSHDREPARTTDAIAGPSTTTDNSRSQLSPRAPRSYSAAECETVKKVIKYLYLDVDMPLDDVVDVLSKENNFHTNVRMCKTRLKRWGFTKNDSKHRKSDFRREVKPAKHPSLLKRTARRLHMTKNKAHHSQGYDLRDMDIDNLSEGEENSIYEGRETFHEDITIDETLHAVLDAHPPESSHVDVLAAPVHSCPPTESETCDVCFQGIDRESEKMLSTEDMRATSSRTQPDVIRQHDFNPGKGQPEGSFVPVYEQSCPYRFGEKKFRLIQGLFGDNYQGDSLGYGTYINLSEVRPCTAECGCMSSHFPSAFTFVVKLDNDGMNVEFLSESLWNEIIGILPHYARTSCTNRIMDGKVLFEYREDLRDHLELTYQAVNQNVTFPRNSSLSLELELLVHGFLNDYHYRQYAAIEEEENESVYGPSLDFDGFSRARLINFNPWKKLRAHWKNRRVRRKPEPKGFRMPASAEYLNHDLRIYELDAFDSGILGHPPPCELLTADSLPSSSASSNQSSGSSPNEDSNPWKRFRAQWKNRRGQNKLEAKISRLDEAFQDLEEPFGISELHGVSCEGLVPSIDEKREAVALVNWEKQFLASFDQFGEERPHHGPVIQAPVHEMDSRELTTREEFESSRAKNIAKRHSAGRTSISTPELTKKLEEGSFSVHDWITSAAINGDISLVQSLLDLGMDTNVYDDDCKNPPICIAAEFGDLQIVRALLDRGADVNRPDPKGRLPLEVAASHGHRDIVDLFLRRNNSLNIASDLGALLSISAANGRHEVVRLLLIRQQEMRMNAKGKTPEISTTPTNKLMEEALVSAAKSGSPETMQVLLDYGASTAQLLSSPGHVLLTALIGAAADGNLDVVKVLLQSNVDVNGMDHRGTALSAAISSGHHVIVRLLLTKAGGQVLSAIRHLRSCGKRNHIKKLLQIVVQVQRDLREGRNPVQGPLVSTNMHSLRKHFLRQHSSMITAAAASTTKLKELLFVFPSHRDSWAAGIRTLRKLCRGDPPNNILDTIPFLCLSRAMVDTLEELHHGKFVEDFNSDLPRWQMIFASEGSEQELEAYREAIWSMWGVTCSSTAAPDFDEDILQRFHDLASTMASKADLLYGDSPLSSTGTSSVEPDERLESADSLSSGHKKRTSPEDCVPEYLRGEFMTQNQRTPDQFALGSAEAPNRTLAEEIRRDPTIIEPLATILISGAIFAIAAIFMQVLAKVSTLSVSLSVAFPSVKSLARRYELIESEIVKGRSLVHVEGVMGSDYCVI